MDFRLREKIADYRGHTIHLRDNFTFAIRGPLVDEERGSLAREEYESRSKAQAGIDDLLNAEAEAQGAVKLSIPIIAEVKPAEERTRRYGVTRAPATFERVTLKGVNRGNGRALTEPKLSNSDVSVAYPDVEWIAQALAELAAIRERATVLAELLHSVAFRNFSTARDAHEYRRRILAVDQDFKELRKRAAGKAKEYVRHELKPAK